MDWIGLDFDIQPLIPQTNCWLLVIIPPKAEQGSWSVALAVPPLSVHSSPNYSVPR